LGLAITKQVIEQHKGHLDVVSTPGKGSTFTMWLNVGKDNDEPHKESGTTVKTVKTVVFRQRFF